MNEALVGTWAFRPNQDSTGEVLFEIFAVGRMIQPFRQHVSLPKYLPGKMLCSLEGPDTYRIKTKPDADGYLVTMRREGPALIIVNRGLTFVCRRIPDDEIPDWFTEVGNSVAWD